MKPENVFIMLLATILGGINILIEFRYGDKWSGWMWIALVAIGWIFCYFVR